MNVRGVPSSNNSVSWVSAQVNIYIEQGYFRLFSFFAPLEISIDDGLLGSREIPNPSINPKSGLQFYSLLPQWNKFISKVAFIYFHDDFCYIIVRISKQICQTYVLFWKRCLANKWPYLSLKVHILWEGHKIWRIGDFAKFCGLLRIYEL